MRFGTPLLRAGLTMAGLTLCAPALMAAGQYDGGASDTEIVIGNIVPYSGPLSGAGAIGTCHQAYFERVNKAGGINGRKVRVVSLDDGFNPARTLEQARRLVERENALLIYGTFGTATNTAIHHYLNQKQVPQLFIVSGASKWNDPKQFPWTIGFLPSYAVEATGYARHVLDHVKDAKVAVLYENDDYGKEYRNAFRAALGPQADRLIVAEQSYEVTDPTIDAQVSRLKASGANVLLNVTAAKFAAQAVKLVNDSGWKPTHFLVNPASNLQTVIRPAGMEASQGIISAQFMKDPTSPAFQNDPDVKAWREWKAAYNPRAAEGDWWNWHCYATSYTLEQVLKRAGDDLRRANVMKVATGLKDLKVPMLLDGITVNTSSGDYAAIKQMQLMRLAGEGFELYNPNK
ncbi:ABC transporter substrate-binding protein [Variovorax defluvii]|uniref:ABC transporter substrate-binding protein n=1 Tax=Variovorax defluvii TaxID=913761 RepID=A0ABP8HEP6_9BURK